MVDDPLADVNVTSPAEVVNLIGVISLNSLPNVTYSFRCVPIPKYFVNAKEDQSWIDRETPKKALVENFSQPPIFSGLPFLNRILSESNQLEPALYSVPSLLIPGWNCNLCNGIVSTLALRANKVTQSHLQPFVMPPKPLSVQESISLFANHLFYLEYPAL